jgi:hypothetical protein
MSKNSDKNSKPSLEAHFVNKIVKFSKHSLGFTNSRWNFFLSDNGDLSSTPFDNFCVNSAIKGVALFPFFIGNHRWLRRHLKKLQVIFEEVIFEGC